MDRSAQNNDQVMEDEIKKMRMKFVLDVEPLEIIDKEDDEDFNINADVVVVENINQIELVIHVLDHDIMYQYWSLKSGDDSLNSSSSSSSSSSSCHHQHQHHLRDDDDDEDMILITCQPTYPPSVLGKILVDQGIFASCDNDDDDHQNQNQNQNQNVVNNVVGEEDNHADDIMSLLDDVDVLYECKSLPTNEHLEEVKRCITQRISEAKPAVLMAKPKIVRIRVHLSTIEKRYYANSAAANSAAAQDAIGLIECAEHCAIHFAAPQRCPSPELYDKKPASRSSKEALKTKIFEKEDLISSSSSLSCPVCLIEFRIGVDEIMIMPCSHVFHWTCLMDWLNKRNTCPLCRYELPTWKPKKRIRRV